MPHRSIPRLLLALPLALALCHCSQDTIQTTFFPDNNLTDPAQPWDNVISLQSTSSNGQSDTVTVLLHAGRADSNTDPNTPPPPATLLLPGVTRVRATLIYKPDVVKFVSSSAGSFFEQASGGAAVHYDVTAETGSSGPTGRLFIDISIDRSVSGIRKGDFVKLDFQGLAAAVPTSSTLAVSRLNFEGGFGSIERNGRLITGSSYYGGRIQVQASATQ
jgi:hypothetical protein